MSRSETSGQTYSRWFTDWPPTHERAGQTVEVIAIPALLDLIQQLPKRENGGERLTASDFAGLLEASLRGRS